MRCCFPALLGKPAQITSTCVGTGTPIRLTGTPDGPRDVDPVGAVVTLLVPDPTVDVRTSFCVHSNFYASGAAAEAWLASRSVSAALAILGGTLTTASATAPPDRSGWAVEGDVGRPLGLALARDLGRPRLALFLGTDLFAFLEGPLPAGVAKLDLAWPLPLGRRSTWAPAVGVIGWVGFDGFWTGPTLTVEGAWPMGEGPWEFVVRLGAELFVLPRVYPEPELQVGLRAWLPGRAATKAPDQR